MHYVEKSLNINTSVWTIFAVEYYRLKSMAYSFSLVFLAEFKVEYLYQRGNFDSNEFFFESFTYIAFTICATYRLLIIPKRFIEFFASLWRFVLSYETIMRVETITQENIGSNFSETKSDFPLQLNFVFLEQ